MLIPKYKLGQEVWAVCKKEERNRVNVECDLCNSTGKIEVQGYECMCPKCHKETKEYVTNRTFYVYSSGKIGEITTEEYLKKYNRESKITYMLDVTGVGSGTLWSEDMLFETYDKASSFCKEYIPSDEGLPIKK